MTTIIWTVLGASIGFGVMLLLHRVAPGGDAPEAPSDLPPPREPAPRPAMKPAEPPAPPKPKNYHAVSIRSGPDSCESVKAFRGKRYLATEAPPLPVPGCDAAACDCRFRHHEDRRSGEDRRDMYPGFHGINPNASMIEKRSGKERRKS